MVAAREDAAVSVRVGLLLDAPHQEAWVLESVRHALVVPGVSLACVAIGRRFPSRCRRLPDLLIARDCADEPMFAPADIPAALQAAPLEFGVECSDGSWSPDADGLTALRRQDVDVWLCFAALPPRISTPIARLGVWGLEIGLGVPAGSSWSAAGEVVGASALTMISAVNYGDPYPSVLYRSFGATLATSVCANRRRALRKGVTFFKRLLDGVARTGSVAAPAATLGVPPDYPSGRAPTAGGLLRLAARLARARALEALPSPYKRQWQVGYYFADGADSGRRLHRLRYLVPPLDRFWADPFAVEHEGRYFVFLEELLYRTQRGTIVAIEVFENADPGPPQLVLERPYHLSYPFIFRWEGELYMLPETAGNRTIEMYRCERFPDRWTLHTVLREGVRAFDATLCADSGRWWMFVNVAENGADPCDELHLYSSGSPLGPWRAHPRNPVVSDVRCARPAGPVFSSNGAWYRPSQDDSLEYGHAVVINRIAELSDQHYVESPIDRVEPGWRHDIRRVHTFGGAGRLRVVDCMVKRKRW